MKKYFIDCGSYNGDTIEQFYNWYRLIDDPNDFEIIAFEPNPKFKKTLELLVLQKGIKYYQQAVWTNDDIIEFRVNNQQPLGSTAMIKTGWEKSNIIKVESINFSRFIEKLRGNLVIIKMDIEGAEFPVLTKMIEEHSITVPSLIMVEFHPNKVLEYTTTDKLHLIQQIKDKGVKIIEWH